MTRIRKAAGVLLTAGIVSMLVVIVFESVEFLLGFPVAAVLALSVAFWAAWQIVNAAG